MVLVGAGDDCWSWWCAVPWSLADGLFGQLLWSSSLVSGAQGALAGGCRWSRVLLVTGGGFGGLVLAVRLLLSASLVSCRGRVVFVVRIGCHLLG
jgi:hypothetical protein